MWQYVATLIKVILNKSDVKYRNTLVCLDQYMCKVLRLWNSRDCETVYVYKYLQKMETLKQSGPWSSLGTHGSLVVIWWLCISSSGEDRNFIHGANVGPTRGRQKFYVKFDLEGQGQLGPSTLAVPEQLSNGGGKNVGHSPAESGTDFWALCTTSATLWPL